MKIAFLISLDSVAIQVINEKRKSKKCECFKNLKTPFQTLKKNETLEFYLRN